MKSDSHITGNKILLSCVAALLTVAVIIALYTRNDKSQANEQSIGFFGMDTYMEITIYDDSRDILTEIEEEARRLEQLWSVTDEESDIYAINHSNGESVEVHTETFEILQAALDLANRTDSCFSPALYAVSSAWGFTENEYRIPSQVELDTLLLNCDWTQIKLNRNTVTVPEGMELDLGAVGKGYLSDTIEDMLTDYGITSALVNLGGNVSVIGRKPGDSDWKIGVQSPYGDGYILYLELSDSVIITSGRYERYFTGTDGKQYCHIIDPMTGYPVDNDLISVTVVGQNGATCDALSTALFVMGKDAAIKYWRENPAFEMILITEDGNLHITETAAQLATLNTSYESAEVNIITP